MEQSLSNFNSYAFYEQAYYKHLMYTINQILKAMKTSLVGLALLIALLFTTNLSAQTYWLPRKDGNFLRYDVKVPADVAAVIKTNEKEGTFMKYASEERTINGKSWTFHQNTLAWDVKVNGSITWEDKSGLVGSQWQSINSTSAEWQNCWSKGIEPMAKVYNGNWKSVKLEMLENPGSTAPGVSIDLSTADPATLGPLTPAQSMKAFVDKMNQFRTDPAAAPSVIDALLKRNGNDYKTSKEYTQDQIKGKTREEHVATFKDWIKGQAKLSALTWDDDLAKLAASGGKPANRFTKLDFQLGAWGDPLDNALFGWAADAEDGIKRLRDPRLKFIGIAPKPGGSKEEFIIIASEVKGSLFTAKDADFANRPFQLNVTDLGVKANSPFEKCPQIIGQPNSDGSLDIAWLAADGNKIYVHRAGANLQSGQANGLTQRRVFNSLGLFAGYTRVGDDDFVLSAQRSNTFDQPLPLKLFKNNNNSVVWSGKNTGKSGVLSPLIGGTSKLVSGNGKLFVAINGGASHPYVAMVDANKMNQTDDVSPSYNTHNFDQRLIWDGKNFVVMENRDHSFGTTLIRFSPTEKYPFEKQDDRCRTIHSHTNYANDTHTELGAVQPGLNGGYLAVIATEHDWDDKFTGKPYLTTTPIHNIEGMTNPFDVMLVHVKPNFDDESLITRLDPKRAEDGMVALKDGGAVDFGDDKPEHVLEQHGSNLTWGGEGFEPWYVDASRVVNSNGEHHTISRNSSDDGFNYMLYSGKPNAYEHAARRRHITTAGMVWATHYGDNYHARIPKDEQFTTAVRPRLVKINDNTYIALWEEHNAQIGGCIALDEERWPSQYKVTKAAKVTLSNSGDKVNITVGTPKEVSLARLHWHDDAFNYKGKAAWLTGDAAGRKIILHTVDSNLNYTTYELSLP